MTMDMEGEAMETTTMEQQEQQQQQEGKNSSSSAVEATLERRYGSLRPAAVGLLAKVRRRDEGD